MKIKYNNLEHQRLILQAKLDSNKTQQERNKMGQFSTPPVLAQDILRHAQSLLPLGQPIHFLDPAIGTGAFYSALCGVYEPHEIAEAKGFEIDPHYGRPTVELWSSTRLSISISDFTQQTPDPRFNLLICNPPYVRHHHLNKKEKARLQHLAMQACDIQISGLAGLYCYFLGLSHAWMSEGAVAGWLVPSEFMDVNYGATIKQYLLEKVTLLRIHRFEPQEVQFADALVSSAIVWLRNSSPPPNHSVTFSFGGTLSTPSLTRQVPVAELAHERKWTRFPSSDVRQQLTLPVLSDFFNIKRGLATGDNSFFILSEEEIMARNLPTEVFQPILPSPRYLTSDEINTDKKGYPCIERRLFLLDPRMSEEEIQQCWPLLWKYLEEGKAKGLHKRYLCSHRKPWYSQEKRPPAPIICTYLGRRDAKGGQPFRFLLNHSQATVANVYLAMYPTSAVAKAMQLDSQLIRKIWSVLNQLKPEHLLDEGRVYGGGLHKLEPRELANVPADQIAKLLPKDV